MQENNPINPNIRIYTKALLISNKRNNESTKNVSVKVIMPINRNNLYPILSPIHPKTLRLIAKLSKHTISNIPKNFLSKDIGYC